MRLRLPSYLEPVQGFQPQKAAELCALLISFSGGKIEKLKLIKIIYLTERQHLADYEEPILWDEFFSLPHGPTASAALNCIDGVLFPELTQNYFALHRKRDVCAVSQFSEIDCEFLSDAEIGSAKLVWERHKTKTASQLRNYTHKECPEYFELEHGRRSISYQDVLSAVGVSDPEEIAEEILSFRQLRQ
ncbi:MAG: SocA family protein [Campylobacterales bacterium]|nr:SocA family protein [Campylobacterales bacterium]